MKFTFYPYSGDFREELYVSILDAFVKYEDGKNEISVDHGEEELDYGLQVVAFKDRRSKVKADRLWKKIRKPLKVIESLKRKRSDNKN